MSNELAIVQDAEIEYEHLLEEMRLLKEINRERLEKAFIPDNADAKPFFQQEIFFKSETKTQLLRCGNRAAKTFSWVRDRAWKLMRNHPYKKAWSQNYEKSQPKLFWMVGPTFEFCTQVVWETYLSKMIPDWYWTDDNGKPMIEMMDTKLIDKVRFRNGDVIEFKTYSQSLLSKMGRAIDDLSVDEMPPHLKILTELIVRVLDSNGDATYAFTPVNPNPEIKAYLDNHPGLELHSWSVLDNPVYHDFEKRSRLLDEYAKLSAEERDTRLNGQWYVQIDNSDRLMQGTKPKLEDDFPIPPFWRRARVADPAAIRTGVAWFAENPDTGVWYCYAAKEIQWGDQAATADALKAEIGKDRPYPGFKYCMSLYDNHELWFFAHGPREDWVPCMQKNREEAVVTARDAINIGRVVFFKRGAIMLLQQMAVVKASVKYKDHMLDCLMYFCRQIPHARKTTNIQLDEHAMIYAQYQGEQEKASTTQERVSRRTMSQFRPHAQRLMRRGLR